MKRARKVSIIEQTNDRVMVREEASYGISLVFVTFALGGVFFLAYPTRQRVDLILGSIMLVQCSFLGLYCCVESSFGVSRGNEFYIIRSLFGFERIYKYPLQQIRGVVRQETLGKGQGLQLHLASGRKKGLTMSLHYQYMGDEALALDSAIRAFKKRSRADHRVREERGV